MILQKHFLSILLVFSLVVSCNPTIEPTHPKAKRVVVIGFDGLSPDGLQKAHTPTFDTLMKQGAYSFNARAVLPTSSSTNWASMITGAGPEQHGITSNRWEKNNLVLPPVVQSEDFMMPSIFHLIHSQKENANIGAIYHWTGFGRLFEKSAVDYDINPESEDKTAELAAMYITEKKPDFTFIHFDHVDHAGHAHGHGSSHYYESVEKADRLLATVMTAIKESDPNNETLVIVSSDHGGLGNGHGGETLAEIEIPFIIWGPSVKTGHAIKAPIYQYDNAATVAYALGLEPPLAWIGKPVKTAFEGHNTSVKYPVVQREPAPIISPRGEGNKKAGGLFDSEAIAVIEAPHTKSEIHYTLDGSLPSLTSPKYTGPIVIKTTSVLKAALFLNENINSTISEGYFRIKSPESSPNVSYEVYYFDQPLEALPNLGSATPAHKGQCFEMSSEAVSDLMTTNTVVRFKSHLTIDTPGKYYFYTRSDDGSKLWVNQKEIVNNDGNHGVRERSSSIELTPGVYPIEVQWYNGGGGFWLDIYFQKGKATKQMVHPSVLITP